MKRRNRKIFLSAAAALITLFAGSCAAWGAQVLEHSLLDYDEATYENFGSGCYQTVCLSEEEKAAHPQLAQAIDEYFSEKGAEMEGQFKEYCDGIREIRGYGTESDVAASLVYEILPRRSDEQICSFLARYESYSGGVHGYQSLSGINFDTASGKLLEPQDVFADEDLLRTVLEQELTEKYPDSAFVYDGASLEAYGFGGEKTAYTWLIDQQGVTFFFNPYEIASYAEGILSAKIGFYEHAGLFTEDFEAQGSYAYAVPMWADLFFDLDGNGSLEPITFSADYSDYSVITNLYVHVGDNSCMVGDIWGYEIQPALMHLADGRTYLYLEALSDNDWHSLYIVDLTGGIPSMVGTSSAEGFFRGWDEETNATTIEFPTDPENFKLITRFNLLGTYGAGRSYAVGADGMPVPLEEAYTVSGVISLRTVKELPAYPVDPASGEVSEEMTAVPSGTDMTIVRTDGESYADLRLADGSMVRVMVDGYKWPHTIEGEEEASFFEELHYAG